MLDGDRPAVDPARVFFGGVLMLVGLGLLLDRTGWLELDALSRFWPLLLVGLGVVKLALPRRGRSGGAWLVLVGLLLLGDSLKVLTFRQSWPLFLVAAGGSIVWKGLSQPREARRDD